MNTEVHLTTSNNLVSLSELIGDANLFLETFGLPSRVMYLANLTLEEVLTNIIKYGFDDDADHEIYVALGVKPAEVWIECSDDGREFDPLAAPEPEFKECIHDCEEGGLGIHLVRKMADSVEYRRDHSKNILTVRINLPLK